MGLEIYFNSFKITIFEVVEDMSRNTLHPAIGKYSGGMKKSPEYSGGIQSITIHIGGI